MRLKRHDLTRALALAAVIALTGTPAGGQEADETDRIVATTSFSGAFLAARAAELDNDLGAAIAFYERALSFDPDNQALQQGLLLALISNGDFDAALPYAQKLKSVPEVERFSRLALAVDAMREGAFGDARDWLEIVLESDLDRLITGVMSAWASQGEGDTSAALDQLDGLSGPEWYDIFTTYHRALVAAGAGRDDVAVAAFEAILDDKVAGAGAPDTYMRAVEAYAAYQAGRGEREQALATLDAAEEFITGRAATLALRERIAAGESVSPPVAGPAAGAGEILLNLASALNRGGSESFVRLYLQYARALRPDDAATLIELASVAERQNEPERAIALYEQVPDSSPMKRVAELQLGLNLADLERHEEAIEHLTAALAADPDDMRAYVALGSVHAARKDFAAAAEVYDRAVTRIDTPEREHWNIYYQRGIAYERLKQWEKAEPNLRKALELYPEQPQVLNYLGYSLVDMNRNLEEALEMIRRAVELRPSDGYIVDSLGWAYYRLGRFEEAVQELERAVSLKPSDPILNDHLGDAYWRAGRRLEARFQWSHARDLEPEPDVLAAVERKLEEGLPPQDETAAPEDEAAAPQPEEPVMVAQAPAAGGAAMQDAMPADDEAAGGVPAAYVVKPGETLWSIAVDRLGRGDLYIDILEANPALQGNPDLIRPGQELRMPAPR